MTELIYLVKTHNGKGCFIERTLFSATKRAEEINGYITTQYKRVNENLSTNKTTELREKRLEAIKNGGKLPSGSYR